MTNNETIVAVYDTKAHAAAAVQDLETAGVPSSAITQHAKNATTTGLAPTTAAAPARAPGFWASLFGGEPERAHDTTVYDRSLEEGSTVVTVKAPEQYLTKVLDILERHNPIDIDERAASYAVNQMTEKRTMDAPLATGTPTGRSTDDQTMQLAEETLAVGKRALYRTIRAFGFGDPTEVELPGENPGILSVPDAWSGSQLATISFGHGISITPIALVRAYAAIANGGTLLRPRIVHALTDPDGTVIYRYQAEVERRATRHRGRLGDAVVAEHLSQIWIEPFRVVAGDMRRGLLQRALRERGALALAQRFRREPAAVAQRGDGVGVHAAFELQHAEHACPRRVRVHDPGARGAPAQHVPDQPGDRRAVAGAGVAVRGAPFLQRLRRRDALGVDGIDQFDGRGEPSSRSH